MESKDDIEAAFPMSISPISQDEILANSASTPVIRTEAEDVDVTPQQIPEEASDQPSSAVAASEEKSLEEPSSSPLSTSKFNWEMGTTNSDKYSRHRYSISK